MRDAVAPDWLVQVVRPRRVPVPWALMLRAGLAVCVPLAAGLLAHEPSLGLLPAIGGLIAVVVDTGGPYVARVRRVGSAAVFGGAAGLTIGTLIHGRGALTVIVLVLVAGVSVLLSELGSTGSVTGLQLLVYSTFGLGPLGALRPWWTGPAEFLIGVAWAMILIVPGWLLYPRAAEADAVANVYHAIAARLRATGTGEYTARRRAVTDALNIAYDQLLTARSAIGGADARLNRLVALLNHTHLMAEAAAAMGVAGERPPPEVTSAIDALADAIRHGTPAPAVPPPWRDTPAADALHEALTGAVRLLTGTTAAQRQPPGSPRPAPGSPRPAPGSPRPAPGLRDRLASLADNFHAGRQIRTYAVRLMASIGVAGVLSEVLPLQRSYWVVLTVAIVLRPDFGSVFARALQRGIGTIVGTLIGAVILAAVPYGLWLLVPAAVLAALLPYGRAVNFGLMSTFQAPLIVLLIDLLSRGGWQLAADRLLDTLLGCAIALLVGYAPWPGSWQAHLPERFAEAASRVARYTERALDAERAPAGAAPDRSRLRRQTSRYVSDVRTEFQRAMSEPRAVSRRVTTWWPALVGLEQVVDAVTATAVAVEHGAPAPAPDSVRTVARELDQVAAAIRTGTKVPPDTEPPSDEALRPVTDAVRGVLAVVS